MLAAIVDISYFTFTVNIIIADKMNRAAIMLVSGLAALILLASVRHPFLASLFAIDAEV
nr:hypothetical protein [Candidatus Sigynarchaeum springense]